MVSDEKGGDVEKRFSNLNLNLKRSFSGVKRDIQKLAKTNEKQLDELNKKLVELEEDYVARQDFNNEIDSFNKKYGELRKELKKGVIDSLNSKYLPQEYKKRLKKYYLSSKEIEK